jgi:hypothetical protein
MVGHGRATYGVKSENNYDEGSEHRVENRYRQILERRNIQPIYVLFEFSQLSHTLDNPAQLLSQPTFALLCQRICELLVSGNGNH